jgi:hypothetical protein
MCTADQGSSHILFEEEGSRDGRSDSDASSFPKRHPYMRAATGLDCVGILNTTLSHHVLALIKLIQENPEHSLHGGILTPAGPGGQRRLFRAYRGEL